MISEEIKRIALKLRTKGYESFNNILLDDSAFQLYSPTDGLGISFNPYDADNSALVVNFNTINIQNAINKEVSSAESQTPTLPLMKSFGRHLPPGRHRINISQTPGTSLQYVGQLFKAIFADNGIQCTGQITEGRAMDDQEPIYSHKSSFSLEEVVVKMLRYSNNFIANQLFLASGAKQFGYPATWDKARKTIKLFLAQKYKLQEPEILVFEGSGISRKNRLTVNAMLKILDTFKPYAHLLPEKDGMTAKTGTLTGVYSLAGYLQKNSRQYPFAIILNQKTNNRNLILKQLAKQLP